MSTPSVDNIEALKLLPLKVLPTEAAIILKEYAEKSSLCGAQFKRFKRRTDETDARHEASQHFNSFEEKCKGFLSEETCQNIKSMLKFACKHEVNTSKSQQCFFLYRRRYEAKADKAYRRMETHHRDVISKREISNELADNLKQMGLAAARYVAYSKISACKEEEKKELMTKLNTYYDKIHGEINVVAMTFNKDGAQILSEEPKVLYTKTMENEGDVEQSMNFSFIVTEGKTSSTTDTVNFRYGVGTTFSAGFTGIGQFNFELSFNFSKSHSFQTSINKEVTKTYDFPLVVPAHSTYVAKAMVHEVNMKIPYELVLDFGGACRSVRGIWKGVVCSEATYKIVNREGPRSPSQSTREGEEEEEEEQYEGWWNCLIM